MCKRLMMFLWMLAAFSGCKLLDESVPEPAAVAPSNFLGTISMVNEDGQFVLIDFGGFTAPLPGAELQVRRAGEDVATVKAGAEMRRPFAAADIVQGVPQVGDDVWSKNPTP